ncbi:antitoxin [Allopusillimonas ginsengisoli]|uniref:antitoxin n=1 Tax=Allopusillimonas ginsengisoli TaxID=453575 RepID=UPI0010223073|nr:antitoxin [Allopusillimonas ginsengisoli]TEA80137.1 antitoxin [Allopusillimonas ginsengisoli]
MTISTTNSRPREAKLFRNNRSQAVRIPAEFEMPGDRVLIRREGARLIIEPVSKPRDIVALLGQWRKSEPLAPQDRFPDISDAPPIPDEVL